MTVREVYEALVSLLEKRESYNFIIYKNTYSEKRDYSCENRKKVLMN